MKVEKSINNNTLTVKIEGRIDTNTVSILENELSVLDGIENLIFDFEKVEYISSSGLRLMLKCKKQIDSTRIINCSTDVYEIFDMTGFAEMMEIEKALRKISIDNCEKIGEGFFGIIYRIDPETIVKVYKDPNSLETIKRERELAKRAFVMGIPTAIPYDIVRVDNSYGAVFELLNAKPVKNLITSEDELDEFTKKSAMILKDMHQKEIESGVLPSRKEALIRHFKGCEKYFTKDVFEKILYLLNTIPETNTLLHCDFHIKNIMMQNDDLLLIDMDTLSVGHPIFEFGAMYATYYGFSCIDKKNTDRFLGIPLDVSNKIFDKTFEYYYEGKSSEELESIKQKLSVISYIQILSLRTKYTDEACATEKEEIEFCINYLTDMAEKLETLEF